MASKLEIRGLWVPLLTPFNKGKFDRGSLLLLIKSIEPHVDGFVPCLTTGEGFKMDNELWIDVIKFVMENTKKPVAAGILLYNFDDILKRSELAKQLGCTNVVVPIIGNTEEEKKQFCEKLSGLPLPVIIYNTEDHPLKNLDILIDIDKNQNIIAIKDSSKDQAFFNQMVSAKEKGSLKLSILQGMENQLLQSAGCDGYLIALANAEPQLCKDMLENPTDDLNEKIMQKWNEYNLASDTWYVDLKQALTTKNIIKTSELIS